MQDSSRIHLLSLGQLILSSVGLLFSLTVAAVMALLGVISMLPDILKSQAGLPFFSMAWISGLVSLLLLPSIILALRRLSGRPQPKWHWQGSLRPASFCCLVLWPVSLIAGNFISEQGIYQWLFLPPLQILAIGIPLWWLVAFGERSLEKNRPIRAMVIDQPGQALSIDRSEQILANTSDLEAVRVSPGSDIQRRWGVLSVGLVITPALTIFIEIVMVAVLTLLFIYWMSFQPGMADQLLMISQRIANAVDMGPEVLARIFKPVLERPEVIIFGLLVVAGLIPLLEELFKSLGVWALARSKITPEQGFSAGLISGAAFALVESLGYLATPSGSGWLGVVVGRTGTGLLHVTTTGLMGWALACAWEEKHYRRLVLAYLGAVGLHSFWNIFGLLVALPSLIGQASVQTSTSVGFFVNLGQLAPFALGIEAILLLLILFAINRQLTKGKINGLD